MDIEFGYQINVNILSIHQNFPGQFKHLAPALARLGHKVVALHINPCLAVPGVELVRYGLANGNTQDVHRWLADLATKTLRAEAAWQASDCATKASRPM